MIHEKTAKKMSLHVGNRVVIEKNKKRLISIVNTASEILRYNEIAVSDEIIKRLKLKNKDIIDAEVISSPHTINLIKKKLKGGIFKKSEIEEIVEDIRKNALTEVEIAFFISAVYENGMNLKETKHFIQAMVKNSSVLKLRGKVVDKHCIGGVAGNRTTPIIVAICASTGLIMPKTSSRAITSASGTADVIETLARVNFSPKEIKKIIKKTNACFVWGGAIGLVPVDSKIIKIERIINIDSPAQMIAVFYQKKLQ
jgi:AMP phosphorylase